MTVAELPDLESQREQLRATQLRSPRSWRILHLGGAVNGATDIVASMLRALRDLGHTVLHVDTKQTRQTVACGHVDFSSGARGGFGPVYVRLASIEPTVPAPECSPFVSRRSVSISQSYTRGLSASRGSATGFAFGLASA